MGRAIPATNKPRRYVVRNVLGAIVLLLLPAVAMAQGMTQSAGQGIEYRPLTKEALLESDPSAPLSWKILVDAANLGSSETRIAELTLNTDYVGQPHTHDAIEIFYVLSGRFGHNVNGVPGVLEPGEIGICRPGDTIIHSVEGDEPAVVLTIWLPGGAAAPFHTD